MIFFKVTTKPRLVPKKVTLTSDEEEAHITSEEEATAVHLSDEEQYLAFGVLLGLVRISSP